MSSTIDKKNTANADAAALGSDDVELSEAMIRGEDPRFRLVHDGRPRPGRPKGSSKARITIMLDKDVLDHFGHPSKGYQSRLNQALRKAAGLD